MKISEIKPGHVEIQGWIENLRDKKSMQFVVIRDLSGKIQVTIVKEENPEIAEIFSHATLESTVKISGKAVANEYVKLGGIEILPDKVEITSRAEAFPIGPESSIDQRLDFRWIDLRTERTCECDARISFATRVHRDSHSKIHRNGKRKWRRGV